MPGRILTFQFNDGEAVSTYTFDDRGNVRETRVFPELDIEDQEHDWGSGPQMRALVAAILHLDERIRRLEDSAGWRLGP